VKQIAPCNVHNSPARLGTLEILDSDRNWITRKVEPVVRRRRYEEGNKGKKKQWEDTNGREEPNGRSPDLEGHLK
jgi:hypothetical protein